MMNAPVVWSYWEGGRRPFITKCLGSIARVCGNALHLVTPMNIGDYLPNGHLHPAIKNLREPAWRADVIRAALLATHGGFWIDADTVMLRPPWHLATDHDLVHAVWDNSPRRVFNGYIYARPGSALACEWLRGVNASLDANPRGDKWTGLGEQVLTPLVDGGHYATREVPRSTWCPLDVDRDVLKFFEPGDPVDYITEESVCFGLNNSWMMAHRREIMAMSAMEMRLSPLLIHRLLTEYA